MYLKKPISMKINKVYITVIVVVIIMIAIWLLSGIFIYTTFGDDKGSIGDMFGAPNALFSGLALLGVIYALIMQRKDLELQRKELQETREEFKITRVTNLIYKQMEPFNKDLVRNRLMNLDGELLDTVSDFIAIYKNLKSNDDYAGALELIRMNKLRINQLLDDSFDAIFNIEHLIDTNYFKDNEKVKKHLRNVIYNSFDLTIKELIKIKSWELRSLYPDIEQGVINREESKFIAMQREISRYSNNPM